MRDPMGETDPSRSVQCRSSNVKQRLGLLQKRAELWHCLQLLFHPLTPFHDIAETRGAIATVIDFLLWYHSPEGFSSGSDR